MDQSVHRPTTRQGSRRPAHPPRAHHRHRHRVLALPPRPAAAHYQERSLTPTEDRAAGIAAPPPPYGLRLHDDARAPHQATSPPTTTDARWSHFKPSRRGQRKPSRRARQSAAPVPASLSGGLLAARDASFEDRS